MTKRKKIATTFVSGLSAITKAGGYKTNFPAVKHWKTNLIPKENELTVIVRDTSNNSTDSQENVSEKLNIEVLFGCCKVDENYDIIDVMIDDIKKWYDSNKKQLEVTLNLVGIRYVNDELAVDQLEKEVGAGKVLFEVETGQHCNWNYDDTNY